MTQMKVKIQMVPRWEKPLKNLRKEYVISGLYICI